MRLTKSSMSWADRAAALRFESRPFIDGDHRRVKTAASFLTHDPARGCELSQFADCAGEEIDRAVRAARTAFRQHWRTFAPDRRRSVLLNVAAGIRRAREDLALMDSLEMGMPISMALSAVDEAAGFLTYYAELADKIFGEIAPADPGSTLAVTFREPRGVIGIISPWNYPLLTAICAIAPALAAGNALVVKPSQIAPSSVLKLAEIAHGSGLPAGVLNVVPGLGTTAGAALASHMDVDMITFTGSTAVARQLLIHAGRSNGKPVVIEAGGKSPQLVFEDAANIDGLGASLAQAAFINTGQLCVARTRLIVHENVLTDVLDAVREHTLRSFTIGNPLAAEVNFGPLASRGQLKRVHAYIEAGMSEGAELATLDTAGEMPQRGHYLQPALFLNARSDMVVAQEEIFGPIMTVLTFQTDEQAVRLANDVSYGLAATAWTRDLGRARRLARDLQAGRVEVRAACAPGAPVAAYSAEPFAGSGHGVLGGVRGLDPYLRLKSVQVITP